MLSNTSILNWPLPTRAFQDQYKQTIINKHSNEHHKVKNPNWQEVDQLAIYKRSREVELRATENNISKWDLNRGPTDFKSGAASVEEEFFELKVSPVEDQSLQQKGKKRRNRKGEKKIKIRKAFLI